MAATQEGAECFHRRPAARRQVRLVCLVPRSHRQQRDAWRFDQHTGLSAQQLSKFVLSSLVVGDGSGAAEIAAAQVPAILGTANETQFQFQEF